MRQRGSASNPPNRFEPLRLDEAFAAGDGGSWGDPDDPEPDSHPDTRLLRDPSRTIIATNSSPDVGFDASVNPYRGCEHGCAYCLAPETPVLHADFVWRPLGDVRMGDLLVGFDEQPVPGGTRRLRPARVERVWWSRRRSLRLVTGQNEVVTTAEHRWITAGGRWRPTERLVPGHGLRHLPVTRDEPFDADQRVGYVAGLSLGDGTFRDEPGWRSDKLGFPQSWWRIALLDREPLDRTVRFLATLGIDVEVRPFSAGPGARPMWKVETRALCKLQRLRKLLLHELDSHGYRRGFLAGFFDAEGSNGSSLRVSQVDLGVLERVVRYARSLGFEMRLEPRPGRASAARLVGSLAERIRFFATLQPAIRRKRDALLGRHLSHEPAVVERVEGAGMADVVDIQTSTRTFYAAGLATHNCYARPTHEYLGMSAGLDFETRILVKERAPELLRRALSAPGWKPQVLAFSGVTDAYQPAERRLEITRGCLRVLAEFRNPVAVVTKSWLVTRDADLLAELARHDAAAVVISVTTLDPALQRAMEPLASRPAKRLAAIEALAEAGVPVGVNVAPLIPGLTDHEVPAILKAAAAAGARFAGRVLLRLPHGVAPLFEAWLERHAPERRAKVLGRMRAMRGGKLYDARFRVRQRGEGFFADELESLFALSCRRAGLGRQGPTLSTAAFRRPGRASQLALFDLEA